MAKPQVLPPSARSLSASLRDLGYSLETAVADIIVQLKRESLAQQPRDGIDDARLTAALTHAIANYQSV